MRVRNSAATQRLQAGEDAAMSLCPRLRREINALGGEASGNGCRSGSRFLFPLIFGCLALLVFFWMTAKGQ